MNKLRAVLGMFLVVIILLPENVNGKESEGQGAKSMSLEACIKLCFDP